MQSRIKYDGIKKVKTDKGDNIILTKKIYSQDTGELKEEVEFGFDPTVIPDRIATLQAEIAKLEDLKSKIDTESFDVVDDKRSDEVKNAVK